MNTLAVLDLPDLIVATDVDILPPAPAVSPALIDCYMLSLPLSLESCCLACHEEALMLGTGLRFWVRLTTGEEAKVCCLCYRALKQQGLVERDLYPHV